MEKEISLVILLIAVSIALVITYVTLMNIIKSSRRIDSLRQQQLEIMKSGHENIVSNYELIISKFKNLIDDWENHYVAIEFPLIQELMEKTWFEKEAILDTSNKTGLGSSTYLIPIYRLLDMNNKSK